MSTKVDIYQMEVPLLRKIWLAILVTGLALTACTGGQTSIPDTPTTTTEKSTPTDSPVPTQTTKSPTQTSPFVADEDPTETVLPPIPPGCTVVSRQFTAEENVNPTFPAVSSADWQIGPAEAALTIIEYADFQ